MMKKSMAKKTKATKTKAPKNRSYKVYEDSKLIPYLNIRGKILETLGIEVGSRWEMTTSGDTIILRKFTDEEIAEFEKAKAQKQEMALARKQRLMQIAEKRKSTYSVDEAILRKPERYLQS